MSRAWIISNWFKKCPHYQPVQQAVYGLVAEVCPVTDPVVDREDETKLMDHMNRTLARQVISLIEAHQCPRIGVSSAPSIYAECNAYNFSEPSVLANSCTGNLEATVTHHLIRSMEGYMILLAWSQLKHGEYGTDCAANGCPVDMFQKLSLRINSLSCPRIFSFPRLGHLLSAHEGL